MQEEYEASTTASGPEWTAPFALDEEALEAVNPGALSTTSNYCQLDPHSRSIHLLTIAWNQDLGEVECWTETCSLDDVPLYTALSYTWGRPDADSKVILDGRKIAVTKNLRRFLHHAVRLPKYGSRRYWIDALCIDQSNLEERSQQVVMMPTIYSTACSVLIWLGPAYDSVEAARTIKALRRPYDSELWRSNKSGGVRSLCERRYWTRLWVVQELRLASEITILCGAETLPWNTFVRYIRNAAANPPRWRIGRDRTSDYEALVDSPATVMIKNVVEAQESARLFDLVLAFKRLSCVDPRDKVYALLGITDNTDRLTADYSVSIVVVLLNVLRDYHKIVKPQSLEQVRAQCSALCDAAGLTSDQTLGITGVGFGPHLHAFLEHLGWNLDRFKTLLWGETHSLQSVVDLWYRENSAWLEDLFCGLIQRGQEDSVRKSIEHGLIRPKYSHLSRAFQYKQFGIATILLQYESVDINEPDKRFKTPLMRAVEERNEENVHFLLKDTRVDVNKKGARRYDSHDETGVGTHSPLHLAIWFYQQRIVELLLHHPDIDINCKDDRGCTPLHAAISEGSFQTVKRLLQDDRVNLNGQCFLGCIGDSISCAGRYIENWKIKRKSCPKCTYLPSVLCAAIEVSSQNIYREAIVEALLERPDLDVNEGQPLHRAIECDRHRIVRMLLTRDDLHLMDTTFSLGDKSIERPGTLLLALQQVHRPAIVRSILQSGKTTNLAAAIRGSYMLGVDWAQYSSVLDPSGRFEVRSWTKAVQSRVDFNRRSRRRHSDGFLSARGMARGSPQALTLVKQRYDQRAAHIRLMLNSTLDDLSPLELGPDSGGRLEARYKRFCKDREVFFCKKCRSGARHSTKRHEDCPWIHDGYPLTLDGGSLPID